jgi:hypothetical protein
VPGGDQDLARDRGLGEANVVGAHRLAERLAPDAVIVMLAIDAGFKYMSVSPFNQGEF